MNAPASPSPFHFSPADETLMRRALAQARRGVGRTYPNPAVGAVVARDGVVLGEGYHKRAGRPHAEVEALEDCRRKGHPTQDATLYVTLEPCNHEGRTPPCTQAILAARIGRVVAAVRDPNPRVTGGGLQRLHAAGVRAQWGLLEQEAREINPAFHHFHETGRPWITLKWAMTLDGCTSARTGAAFWITGEAARRDAHRLRAEHACVAVGIGTILQDDPHLTVRLPRWNRPWPDRLVVDSRLLIPEGSHVIGDTPDRLIVATCEPPDSRKALQLKDLGVRMIHIPPKPDRARVSVTELVSHLSDMEIQSVLVEGGRQLAGTFFAERMVERVVAYIAPSLMGSGEMALGPLLGGDILQPSEAPRLEEVRTRRVGEDWRIEGRPRWP